MVITAIQERATEVYADDKSWENSSPLGLILFRDLMIMWGELEECALITALGEDGQPESTWTMSQVPGTVLRRMRILLLLSEIQGRHKGMKELGALQKKIQAEDIECLVEKGESYGDSWKQRGMIGAFFVIVRKWDRLRVKYSSMENELVTMSDMIREDEREEGVLADVADLRRYLLLVSMERV